MENIKSIDDLYEICGLHETRTQINTEISIGKLENRLNVNFSNVYGNDSENTTSGYIIGTNVISR